MAMYSVVRLPASCSLVSGSETIGVDLGGTKMLVGVLAGTEPAVRAARGLDRPDRGRAGRAAGPRDRPRRAKRAPTRSRSGSGSRRRSTTTAASRVSAVNLPLADLPIRDLVSERVGLPVFVDNDANVAALAEYLYGAAAGQADTR